VAADPRARTKAVRGKGGFALPTVLAIMLVVSLTFATCILALKGLRDETRQTVASIEFERAAMSAEARLAFLISTEPLGPEGLRIGANRLAQNQRGAAALLEQQIATLDLLRFDDRQYRWLETGDETVDAPYLVQVQDEAGLVNLFQADPAMLGRLFQLAGLDEDQAELLATELTEFNALPPPSQPIRRLSEIYRLPSARDLLSDKAYRTLLGLSAVHPDSRAVNINTAPPNVLKVWFDLTDDQAAKALDDRDAAPLGSPADIGVPVIDNSINYAFPGGRVRFTMTDPRTGQVYRSTLVMTPTSPLRPVWTENSRIQRQPPPPEPVDELEDFPEVPDSPA
jgi:hypothetical protein